MMHNAFSLQNQSYFPSTQGTALCFINCFTLPQISVVTWQGRRNHVQSSLARPATRIDMLALTHRHAHTIQSDKETNAFWNLIRVGDSCHFLSVSPGKFSTHSRAWKVFVQREGAICVCVSERLRVNVTVWGTAGIAHTLSVIQPGCLMKPLFVPDLCVMILIYISEPHFPHCAITACC